MGLNKGAVVLVMMLCSMAASTQGRKLLMKEENSSNKNPSAEEKSLYLTALPKGKVAASTPSRRGHATTFDQEFIARHLAAMDRILRSVPSPGVGH